MTLADARSQNYVKTKRERDPLALLLDTHCGQVTMEVLPGAIDRAAVTQTFVCTVANRQHVGLHIAHGTGGEVIRVWL